VTYYSKIGRVVAGLLLLIGSAAAARAQAPGGTKPAEKAPDKPTSTDKASEKASFPFQIQLLETQIRFETNGDSRKEVHTIVKLNDLMGVREFGRLTFDYNRSFQQVEIPMVRITHVNGGTSDVLPSAITDAPNPAVEKYPAYQDVRVKSVRILGLREGDTIEYRVITSTTHHPLAPDFWLEHTFDRSGEIEEENYEIEIPGSKRAEVIINPQTPATEISKNDHESIYRWERKSVSLASNSAVTESSAQLPSYPDVVLSTFSGWLDLAVKLNCSLSYKKASKVAKTQTLDDLKDFGTPNPSPPNTAVRAKANELTKSAKTGREKLESIYDFVSTKIATVDLPLGSTGYSDRAPDQILSSGYATQEGKLVLLRSLATEANYQIIPVLTGFCDESALPRPSAFKHLDMIAATGTSKYWMDPSLEVAPFGVVAAVAQNCAFYLETEFGNRYKPNVWGPPPVISARAFQKVGVVGTIGQDGKLSARVKYTMRGQNELLLRMAFHKTAKEKWKDVAGLLALSDGFRGVITSVNASDPMATQQPFTVEYELTQEKFVDWAKKPVRIPALLPQIGLPDTSARTSAGNIELGTPLDVETQLTLHLPAGTTVQTPAGTAVERDYATYSSKYGMSGETLSAARHIHFLRREVAGNRAADYNAFAQAVQNDQAQYFVLDRGVGVRSAAKE
jgi:hypothetical protein